MDHLCALFEVKAVDHGQRIVEGHAAVFGNLDRVGDVLDVKAFDRTLSGRPPADVAVFVGHQHQDLPIGEALEVRPDAKGLFTKTLVLDGPDGDRLLSAARKGLLGLSIGYYARKSAPERLNGKTVRRLLDVDLVEYSFAAKATIANPDALVTAVKQLETKPWHVVKRGGEFCVVKKMPDGSSGRSFGCHPTEAEAMDQMRALYAAEGRGEMKDAPGAVPDEPVWAAGGAAERLDRIARELGDLVETVVAEQKAMALLGEDLKGWRRVRPELRLRIGALADALAAVRQAAENADRDGEALAARELRRRRLALMEV